jgi:hypothetical protein
MITPEQVNTIGMLELVAKQQQNSFNRVVPPIDKIADKNILLLWQLATCVMSEHTYTMTDKIPRSKSLSTS